MTWLISSVLFIIFLLIVITIIITRLLFSQSEIGELNNRLYKSQSQMNSVICQLSGRNIEIKGIWSDDVRLEDYKQPHKES
jgi:ABC-type multidrug transport system fused ATPase/permease subunit